MATFYPGSVFARDLNEIVFDFLFYSLILLNIFPQTRIYKICKKHKDFPDFFIGKLSANFDGCCVKGLFFAYVCSCIFSISTRVKWKCSHKLYDMVGEHPIFPQSLIFPPPFFYIIINFSFGKKPHFFEDKIQFVWTFVKNIFRVSPRILQNQGVFDWPVWGWQTIFNAGTEVGME